MYSIALVVLGYNYCSKCALSKTILISCTCLQWTCTFILMMLMCYNQNMNGIKKIITPN